MLPRSFSLRPVWLTILVILLSSFGSDYSKIAEERLTYARSNQGDIEIVAIHDPQKENYIKGILLAATEINQRSSKLLGRKLKVNIEQEGKNFDALKPTLQRITSNPKITAVLGHSYSSIALPASLIYDQSNIIFMPSFSTIKSLTGHGFQYVFRMAPDSKIMGEQFASVAKTLGYKKMVILYERSPVSREFAFLFEDAAVARNIKLIKRSSFSEKNTNYRSLISQFNNDPFDAIFIASPSLAGAIMVKQLREMGIQQPILGSDSFNDKIFTDTAGKSADNVITPSFYYPHKNNVLTTHFIQTYHAKYKQDPDTAAAQGYDSLMLLATAIEQAGSTIPSLLASTLHYMPAWIGVTGLHKFAIDGNMLGKKYFFRTWENNQWQYLTAIHMPYLLERFEKSQQQDYRRLNKKDKKLTNYLDLFENTSDEEQYKIHLLKLAHDILGFKSIGIIYENTEKGRKTVDYGIVKQFTEENKIKLIECHAPFSILLKKEVKQQFSSCFGKLSLDAEALFLPYYDKIDQEMLLKLTHSLSSFKIPAISLDRRTSHFNISLLLGKRSDIDLGDMDDMQIYNGLLNNIKLNNFAEYLIKLAEISADIYRIQEYDLPDSALLTLSPSSYLNADKKIKKVKQ